MVKICDVAFTVRFVTVRRRKPSLPLGPILGQESYGAGDAMFCIEVSTSYGLR